MMCCSIPSKVTIPCLSKLALAGRKRFHRNPKEDPALVQKKQQITEWLEIHRCEIASGALVVFFQDECHLLWGDLCGYVWAAAFGGKLPPETLRENGGHASTLVVSQSRTNFSGSP